MPKTFLLTLVLSGALACAIRAEVATPPAVSGWRGDGSGKYPNANPPLDWGQISKSVKELSAQSRKPKDDAAPGKEAAIADGVIRQWLVLGPLSATKESKIEEFLPNAENLLPDENEKAADHAWQAVTLETSTLDFCAALKVPVTQKGMAAFGHTYIYSPSGASVTYSFAAQGQGTQRVWLNGKLVYGPPADDCTPWVGLPLALKKGWNSLMVLNTKTLDNYRKGWWIHGSLYGANPKDYETHGIVWRTPLPTSGSSAPVIAGDRLFFTMESGVLACANKSDGKLLWIHSHTYADFATDEERKANPEIFAQIDPVVEKLKQTDQSDLSVPWKTPTLEKDWRCVFDSPLQPIFQSMAKVSKQKYNNAATWGCEAGYTPCNPITDGQLVYAVFGSGIAVCYDLQGNLKWKRLLPHKMVEHGYWNSPQLVDGKLIVYFSSFMELDAKTGEVLVERVNPGGGGFGAGALIPAGNEKVLYYPNDHAMRFSDGAKLTITPKDAWLSALITPVVENGVCYINDTNHAVSFKLHAPQGDSVEREIIHKIAFNTDKFPYYYENWYCSSPLFHEGLLYILNNFGVLTVMDMEKGELLYQKELDLEISMNGGILRGGASASPTLAGKYIFICGDLGTTIVLEPGRTFKQVAKLRLESIIAWPPHLEATISNPVFEGDRMYYHSDYALYCIGPK